MSILNDYEEEPKGPDEKEEEPDKPLEGVRSVDIEYKCEDCNYRWRKQQNAYITDEDRSGVDRWFVDDSDVQCPMCGSFNVTRY